jgi:hypothetical protein
VRFQFPCLVHLFLLSKTWRLLHFSRVLQVDGPDAYSMRTVEVHRANLFEKMGVRTAVELAQLLAGKR